MSESDTAPAPRQIFVSHARADAAWVAWMKSVLVGSGVEIISADDIVPGATIAAAVQEAIESTDELWVVHSDASANGPSVAFEVGVAIASGRPIAYLLVDDEPIAVDLQAVRVFDLRSDSLQDLQAALRDAISSSPSRQALSDGDTGSIASRNIFSGRITTALLPAFPAPALPGAKLVRPGLMEALDQAMQDEEGEHGRSVALVGPAASGKTHLAATWAAERRREYSDIAWLHGPELSALTPKLARKLFDVPSARVLVVIDDLANARDLEAFRQLRSDVDLLVTTRSGVNVDSVPGRHFSVIAVGSHLTRAEARELARQLYPTLTAGNVDRMVAATGGHALLVSALLHAASASSDGDPLDLLVTLGGAVIDRAGWYYLDTDDPRLIAEWERAFEGLAEEGSEVDLAEFKRGSWRRAWRRRYSPERTEEILDSAERAAEVAALSRPESDANRNNAEAIARLIEASTAIPNLVVVSGSVLLIKVTDKRGARIISKTLTATQLRTFEANEHLLSHPADALEFLALADNELPPLAEGE